MSNVLSLSRIPLDRKALLAEAWKRIFSKSEIRQVMDKGGSVRSEVEHCLGVALQCVEALCEPTGLIREVSAERVSQGVLLGGRTVIHNFKMRDDLTQGAQASVYLLTCGYDSRDALRWLDGDYSIYHFQNMMGRELLYAMGRQLLSGMSEDFPHRHFSRYAVKMKNEYFGEGAKEAISLLPNYWDARKVISLLDFFGTNELEVTATDSGCLSPVHSLLGVMMSAPVNVNS